MRARHSDDSVRCIARSAERRKMHAPSPISRPSQPATQLGAIPRPQRCLSARGCAEIRLRARKHTRDAHLNRGLR